MYLRDFVERCALSYPDKIAYVDGERQISWLDVARRSRRLASSLQNLGVGKGEAVAMLAYDHIECIEHIFACSYIGAIRVGVNRGYSAAEVVHVVRNSNAKALIVQSTLVGKLAEKGDKLECGELQIIGFGEDHGCEFDYETLIANGSERPELPQLADTDPATISYTSGSTGLPKGVIFHQLGLKEMLVHFVLSVGLRHEDRWLNPTSMAWATFMLNIMSVVNGMTTILPGPDFTARNFLGLCSRNRVTSFLCVPIMLQRVISAYREDEAAFDLSALRLVTYGSSPTSNDLIRSAIDVFGVELTQIYGLTEFCAWATFLRHDDHLAALAGKQHLLRSCGKPGLHCELQIRGENGRRLGPGERGEIWLRGETMMLGYHQLPDLTREVLRDGWLRSHDIGFLDEDGYLYLTDRNHFLIITGAANVFPSLIEETLLQHNAVEEAAVVGAPHPEWGEAVVAMVSLRKGHDASSADLIAFCAGHVAKWEVPKFVEIVEELPRGPTHKILKNIIKDRYATNPQLLPWHEAVKSS